MTIMGRFVLPQSAYLCALIVFLCCDTPGYDEAAWMKTARHGLVDRFTQREGTDCSGEGRVRQIDSVT